MLVWEDNVSNKTTPTIRAAQEPSREARPMDSSPREFQAKPSLQGLRDVASSVVDTASPATSSRRVNAANKRNINGQTEMKKQTQ